tara:strand:- start:515 stop:964 length:450 start_codon:yes stop_codon:yes gene_type:complete
MANVIVGPEAIVNTDRLLVIRYSNFYNDTANESPTIVDISNTAYAHSDGRALASVNIHRIWASVADASSNMDVDLFWVANEGDVFIANLIQAGTGGGSMYHDYTTGNWGGLPRAGSDNGAATYGDIKLDFTDMSAGEGISIIIECRKNF